MRKYKWLPLLFLLLFAACAQQTVFSETESAAADVNTPEEPAADSPLEVDLSATPENGVDIDVITEAIPETEVPVEAEVEAEVIPIDYQTVKPNEVGNFMIIMYHGLSEENPGAYDRKTSDFIDDLNHLYERGYRLISINDLMDGRIDLAAGYTPVVLTFDDGKSSAFSLVETDGILTPKPGCAVDILNRFYEEHPDFGKEAIFYVNGSKDPFAGDGTLAERFAYLLENGYEIGNHTYSHPELSKLDAAKIQEELGRVDQIIRENTDGYTPRSLAYPHGVRPKENLRAYALAGEYEGTAYQYNWGLREGQSIISANPFHEVFDPTNVPRVRGTDDSNAEYEVQDFGYFLRFYDARPDRRYISDGDPNRISVPADQAHLVNTDELGDLELYVYELLQ